MSWLFFTLAAWVALGLEVGLRPALQFGRLGVAPSAVVILAIFVAASAPGASAAWACLALGLMLDLLSPAWRDNAAPAVVLGPNALGLFLAGQLVLAMRGMMIRRHVLTIAFLAFLGSLVAGLVVGAITGVRAMYQPIDWSGSRHVLVVVGTSAYTAMVAVPASFVLFPLAPLFGFEAPAARRGMR